MQYTELQQRGTTTSEEIFPCGRSCAIAMIRERSFSRFTVCDQGCRIARTMHHMGNGNLRFSETVIDGIVPVEQDAQTGGQDIPFRAHFRVNKQRPKTFAQFVDKCGRRCRIIGRYESPDICEFVFGLFRYPECARLANFLFPALIIRSGSKSRTRPVAISISPRRTFARNASNS